MNRSINEERKRKQERKREKGERRKGKGRGKEGGGEKIFCFFHLRLAPLTNFHVQSTIFKILAPAAGSASHPRSARIRKPTPGSGFGVPCPYTPPADRQRLPTRLSAADLGTGPIDGAPSLVGFNNI